MSMVSETPIWTQINASAKHNRHIYTLKMDYTQYDCIWLYVTLEYWYKYIVINISLITQCLWCLILQHITSVQNRLVSISDMYNMYVCLILQHITSVQNRLVSISDMYNMYVCCVINYLPQGTTYIQRNHQIWAEKGPYISLFI